MAPSQLSSCSTDIFFRDREALNSPHASELLTQAEMDGRRREEKESILLRDGRINKAAAPAIYNQRPLGYIRPQPNTEQSRSKFSLSYFAYEMMLCSLALYQVSGDYGWHESSCCCCSFTLDFGVYTVFENSPIKSQVFNIKASDILKQIKESSVIHFL